MLLFFDTETTGLVHNALAPTDPEQPHVVQLAALLTDDDGQPEEEISLIINPGVEIPVGASNVHGITTDKAIALGVDPALALAAFKHFYDRADLLVAHNIKFDIAVMNIAASRDRGQRTTLGAPTFCTMEAASPIVNLPPTERMIAAGFNKPKPPKLEECIKHFFNEGLDGAHDAMVDVMACKRLFFHLKEIGAA